MQNLEIPNSTWFLRVVKFSELLNKQTAPEATQENEHEAIKDRDELTQYSSPLPQQRVLGPQHRPNFNPYRSSTNKAGELEIEVSEFEFGVLIL